MNDRLQKAIKYYESGNNLYQQGKLSESAASFRKALKFKRDFMEAHNNLGNVLKDQGRPKEALEEYQNALKLFPKHPLLLNNVGCMLHSTGNPHKAMEHLREAIAQKPDYADAYSNLGNVYKHLGQTDEAIRSYRKALSLNPYLSAAYSDLGSVLSDLGRLEEALSSLKQAISVDARNIDAYNNLGKVLTISGRPDDALPYYQYALEIDPNNKHALNGLGVVLSSKGQPDVAITSFRRALEIDPGFKEAYLNLGMTLRSQGKLDDAKDSYRRALQSDPEYAQAHESLAYIKTHSAYDEEVRAMEALAKNDNLFDEQRANLGFGLGKAFEDLKEYDKAFEYLLEANRLKRKTYEYSNKETQEIFEVTKKHFSSEFFLSHQDCGFHDATPIFVVGMPRSGTSLVEQILASHPQVFGAGELRTLSRLVKNLCNRESGGKFPNCVQEIDAEEFGKTGAEYVEMVRDLSNSARYVVDKMPDNFMYIGLIKTILPDAKVIHCVRDPMDNCLSIFKLHFGEPRKYAYDLRELGQYYKLYADFMEHIRTTLPGFIYDIRYEELVSDQEIQTRRLLEHCGLPWDQTCLFFHRTERRVATLSATQVRKPMYADSVHLWKRYEEKLEPLRDVLFGK